MTSQEDKKLGEELSAGLEQLLKKERGLIQFHAPFICEGDTLKGKVQRVDAQRLLVGKWNVTVTDSKGIASIERRYSDGKRMESVGIEVRFEVRQGKVQIVGWSDYTQHGKMNHPVNGAAEPE